MNEITVGDRRYRLLAVEHGGRWTAHAERMDTGARVGAHWIGDSQAGVEARLSGWLIWQHQHEAALEALQEAERSYHRAIAGTAFTSAAEGEVGAEQKATLEVVEAARLRLDEVRSQQPGQ